MAHRLTFSMLLALLLALAGCGASGWRVSWTLEYHTTGDGPADSVPIQE